jgi:hypothetical protein
MTDDSDSINNKKSQNSKNSSNMKSFLTSTLSQIITLFLLILIGSIILFNAKVAQSNILPANLECSPYTGVKNVIDGLNAMININVLKTGDEILSEKIFFNKDAKENKKFFDFFSQYHKHLDKSSGFVLYFSKIFWDLFTDDLSKLNILHNFINSNCSESVIVFLLPIIAIILLFGFGFYNIVYIWILFFTNLKYLFTNYKETETNWLSLMSWFKIFVLFIFSFVILFIFSPVVAVIIAFMSIIAPLLLSANLFTGKEKDDSEAYSFSHSLRDIFKYKINIVMYILSFLIILNANSALGSYGAFVALVSFVLLYVFSSIYKQPVADSNGFFTSGLSSYEQTKIICEAMKLKKEGGLADTISDFIKSGGGNSKNRKKK